MTNSTPPPTSRAADQTPTEAQPQYANTKGCLWLLVLGIVSVIAVIALIVFVGDF